MPRFLVSSSLLSCHHQSSAQDTRSIALILDASGSINAKLATSGARMEAAKAAVVAFLGKLDPNVRIGYRVYGHQSPTKARNCKDTELMVGFGSVEGAGPATPSWHAPRR